MKTLITGATGFVGAAVLSTCMCSVACVVSGRASGNIVFLFRGNCIISSQREIKTFWGRNRSHPRVLATRMHRLQCRPRAGDAGPEQGTRGHAHGSGPRQGLVTPSKGRVAPSRGHRRPSAVGRGPPAAAGGPGG